MKTPRFFMVIAMLTWLGDGLLAAEIDLKQQCSAWFSLNDDKPLTPRFGLRYQPTLSLAKAMGGEWKLDSEISLDMYASGSAPAWKDPNLNGEINPYRLWLRLSHSQFEARLGLQKINFGSATVFRPLMWFDRIDPRDPLQVTTGVYGLLLRYYFKNNANIWLWGLYGNPDVKGWETQQTADDTPEFGGRFQAPLFSGEAGVTVHCRRLDPGSDVAARRPAEKRLALDGKWDIGVGLWAEAAFVHRDDPAAARPWQRSFALGIDYTFALGNGLYLLAEQYFSQGATSPVGNGNNGISFSALQARYPLGLLDSLAAVVYFDWRQEQLYSFLNWQRTYDRWQFHVMLFWNPRQAQIVQTQSGNNPFSGRGLQLMAVWNI
ncbi:MAG: hypothetical protein L6428_16415 [Candidatus Aminicenantes bacterium]|nr:hypothetical protein [Acidobacteriota bacterium]MCG2813015.1 hypothetical protein [Candidatus Aminicenantes bacterium]